MVKNYDIYDLVDSLMKLCEKCKIHTNQDILLDRATNPVWCAKIYCLVADLHLSLVESKAFKESP